MIAFVQLLGELGQAIFESFGETLLCRFIVRLIRPSGADAARAPGAEGERATAPGDT